MTNIKIFTLIVIGFIVMLFSVQYTGEESVYTVSAYEMWYHRQWLNPMLYGEPYHRPPLINWLIIGITFFLSWEYSIVAVRLVSAIATFASAGLIFWFLRREKLSIEVASFGTLLYLTMWQVIGGYGWKGYSDALFGSLVFAAMLYGYLSVREASFRWLLFAIGFAYLGFLTKALTSFVFLLSALFVTALFEKKLLYLIKALLPTLFAMTSLLVWFWYAIAPTGERMATGMVSDIADRYIEINIPGFFAHLFSFPLETAFNMLPASAFLLILIIKREVFQNRDHLTNTFGFIALVGFLPYWIAPLSHSRYLMPIYGMVAIYVTFLVRDKALLMGQLKKFLVLVVFLKLAYACVLFPAYTRVFRPPIDQWAQIVKTIVDSRNLFSVDQTWIGISVVDKFNRLNYPRPPVSRAYDGVDAGYILSDTRREDLGVLIKQFDRKLFLYCFGTHCVE
jgi:hypothetical protein